METVLPAPTVMSCGWNFDNSYARLPEVFYTPARPAKFPAPKLTIVNHRLAEMLGLDFRHCSDAELADLFTGQILPPGAEPIAQAYAGHQFGGFTMLGDGRAILLGEQRTPSGQRFDIQFKGSGPTPFSRRGDGKAALGPMLREYIISEAMAALGIPTTRSLAVATTGEMVFRETALRGAVLTRVAASHIRVGTFQYLLGRRDAENLKRLADYTIARHYPELQDSPTPYLDFFRAVVDRQAALIAQWQLIGFIHGVMNTDNMAISGETIDYGPCAFMDVYHPETVFSSIDYDGRYAYLNQPPIGQWNLARFAETLLQLLHESQEAAIEMATAVLNEYPAINLRYWQTGMRRKLGLQRELPEDLDLIRDLLDWMQKHQADFTNTFRDLSDEATWSAESFQNEAFRAWLGRWQARLRQEERPLADCLALMRSVNPAIIPRNHRVEEALAAATERDDLSVLQRLLEALATPFADNETTRPYRSPPPAGGRRYRTFCGT